MREALLSEIILLSASVVPGNGTAEGMKGMRALKEALLSEIILLSASVVPGRGITEGMREMRPLSVECHAVYS